MKKQTLRSVLFRLLFCFLQVEGQEARVSNNWGWVETLPDNDSSYTTGTTTLPDSIMARYLTDIELWQPPTTVTIGKYVIQLDSLTTMSRVEIDDFIRLIQLCSTLIYNEKLMDKLCRIYLPKRLLGEGKKSE